eukprot:5071069-Amphidinium_carterae.1
MQSTQMVLFNSCWREHQAAPLSPLCWYAAEVVCPPENGIATGQPAVLRAPESPSRPIFFRCGIVDASSPSMVYDKANSQTKDSKHTWPKHPQSVAGLCPMYPLRFRDFAPSPCAERRHVLGLVVYGSPPMPLICLTLMTPLPQTCQT